MINSKRKGRKENKERRSIGITDKRITDNCDKESNKNNSDKTGKCQNGRGRKKKKNKHQCKKIDEKNENKEREK